MQRPSGQARTARLPDREQPESQKSAPARSGRRQKREARMQKAEVCFRTQQGRHGRSPEGVLSRADWGIDRGIDEGILPGIDRGSHGPHLRGVVRGCLEGIDRGCQEGIDEGNHRGHHRGIDEGIDKGSHRGNHCGIDRGIYSPIRPVGGGCLDFLTRLCAKRKTNLPVVNSLRRLSGRSVSGSHTG